MGPRAALTQLFGDRKLRVRPDAEYGYAIEGIVSLDVPMQVPGGAGDRTRPEHSTRWLAGEIPIPLEL